jgi:uncharacterized cupredoxin-like copper-binding protein
MSVLIRTAAVVTVGGVFFLLGGCGGGGGDNSAATEATSEAEQGAGGGAEKGATLKIGMGEFFFSPKAATAKAGSTTIEAPNEGTVEHELVLFKTNLNPAKLPTEANGGVDEEKLDKSAQEMGEIADVEAGDTKSEQFQLTPGRYVMFCNLPGHYAQGMYGTLTVTK